MSVDGWIKDHEDVNVTISHPKTRAGHKTDIEMCDAKKKVKIFREMITYSKATDMQITNLLREMYVDLLNRLAAYNEYMS